MSDKYEFYGICGFSEGKAVYFIYNSLEDAAKNADTFTSVSKLTCEPLGLYKRSTEVIKWEKPDEN